MSFISDEISRRPLNYKTKYLMAGDRFRTAAQELSAVQTLSTRQSHFIDETNIAVDVVRDALDRAVESVLGVGGITYSHDPLSHSRARQMHNREVLTSAAATIGYLVERLRAAEQVIECSAAYEEDHNLETRLQIHHYEPGLTRSELLNCLGDSAIQRVLEAFGEVDEEEPSVTRSTPRPTPRTSATGRGSEENPASTAMVVRKDSGLQVL
jgi:hypothetical protein